MFFENIDLFPDDENTYLKAYICQDMPNGFDNRRKAILVIPGGGYSHVCDDREGDAIARAYLSKGFNAFVLRYSVKPYASDFRPLIQAATAIKYIRENAEHFSINPDKVFVVGFSAGGHLAASSGVLWNHPKIKEALGDAPEGIGRPNGMILSYPVISAGEKAHKGSIDNLCGDENASAEERAVFSLENQVDKTTPPAFIWHTFSDNCVPVENSLYFATALRENNIPFEMHIYPDGWHGLALATPETLGGKKEPFSDHVSTWFELSVDWTDTVVG